MPESPLWRPWPIFITSTFRDMQAERDHLRDHVFPILDERLRERREYLEPIDLRRGVEPLTSAEAEAPLSIGVRIVEPTKHALEKLAAQDPGNAGWQRGLVVSYYRLATMAAQQGDHAGANSSCMRCHAIMHRMRQAGMSLDPQLGKLFAQLDAHFRGGDGSAP